MNDDLLMFAGFVLSFAGFASGAPLSGGFNAGRSRPPVHSVKSSTRKFTAELQRNIKRCFTILMISVNCVLMAISHMRRYNTQCVDSPQHSVFL
jgi:hypothetical protein